MANTKITKAAQLPLKGDNILYFVQDPADKVGSNAIYPAWQTDATATIGGSQIDEQTKMGRIVEKASDSQSIALTQYFAPDDVSLASLKAIKEKGGSIKVWRVEVSKLDPKGSTVPSQSGVWNYPAMFGYGVPDSLEYTETTAKLVEVKYTLNIIDTLKDGLFPLADADVIALDNLYNYQNPGETTGDVMAGKISSSPATGLGK